MEQNRFFNEIDMKEAELQVRLRNQGHLAEAGTTTALSSRNWSQRGDPSVA